MELEIKITKDILKKSAFCEATIEEYSGEASCPGNSVGSNCAIALAIRDIFPRADVSAIQITPFYWKNTLPTCTEKGDEQIKIELPDEATEFIEKFDSSHPIERLQIQPFSFKINIPDEVIEEIDIEEIRPLLINHPTLELV